MREDDIELYSGSMAADNSDRFKSSNAFPVGKNQEECNDDSTVIFSRKCKIIQEIKLLKDTRASRLDCITDK